MKPVQKMSRVAIVVLAASGAVACGNAASQLSPTAPSAAVTLGAPALEGFATGLTLGSSTLSGKGRDSSRGKNRDSLRPGTENPANRGRRDNNRVEVAGRVTAVDSAARTFEVRAVVVSVPLTATIRHGWRMLEFDVVSIGDMVQVKGTVEADGITATEVKIQDRGAEPGEGDDEEENGEGGDEGEVVVVVDEDPVLPPADTIQP